MKPNPDPELQTIEPKVAFAEAALFWSLALWGTLARWWKYKRVCAWHKPKPKWIGGNPLARQVTHGICKQCQRTALNYP